MTTSLTTRSNSASLEQRERNLGALGAVDLVAGRLEDLDDEHADDVLVVDHEDAAHRGLLVASGSRSVNVAPRSGLGRRGQRCRRAPRRSRG